MGYNESRVFPPRGKHVHGIREQGIIDFPIRTDSLYPPSLHPPLSVLEYRRLKDITETIAPSAPRHGAAPRSVRPAAGRRQAADAARAPKKLV